MVDNFRKINGDLLERFGDDGAKKLYYAAAIFLRINIVVYSRCKTLEKDVEIMQSRVEKEITTQEYKAAYEGVIRYVQYDDINWHNKNMHIIDVYHDETFQKEHKPGFKLIRNICVVIEKTNAIYNDAVNSVPKNNQLVESLNEPSIQEINIKLHLLSEDGGYSLKRSKRLLGDITPCENKHRIEYKASLSFLKEIARKQIELINLCSNAGQIIRFDSIKSAAKPILKSEPPKDEGYDVCIEQPLFVLNAALKRGLSLNTKLELVQQLLTQLISLEKNGILVGEISLLNLFFTAEHVLRILPTTHSGRALYLFREEKELTADFRSSFAPPYRVKNDADLDLFANWSALQVYSLGVTLAQFIYEIPTKSKSGELLSPDEVLKCIEQSVFASSGEYATIGQAVTLALMPNAISLENLAAMLRPSWHE